MQEGVLERAGKIFRLAREAFAQPCVPPVLSAALRWRQRASQGSALLSVLCCVATLLL